MTDTPSKKKWIQIGIVIIILGSFLNGMLIRNEVGGIIRELMRLVILSGLGILIYGLFSKKG